MKSQRPINTQGKKSHNSAKQHSQIFTYWSYQLEDIKQLCMKYKIMNLEERSMR